MLGNMARQDPEPDGDPLGRDRFQSPGKLWRLFGGAIVSPDDRVPPFEADRTVSDLLRELVNGPLATYSEEARFDLARAVMMAAEDFKRIRCEQAQNPNTAEVREHLKTLEGFLAAGLKGKPTMPRPLALRRVERRLGLDEGAILEAVQGELAELPTKPYSQRDPAPMAALDALRVEYMATTGTPPKRPDLRRNDASNPFFALARATYLVAGEEYEDQTVADHIRKYLARWRDLRG